MDNLKYSIFDILAYFLPGSVLIFTIFSVTVLHKELTECDFKNAFKVVNENSNIYTAILFVIISYTIGVITNLLAPFLLKQWERIRKINKGSKSSLNKSEKYVLVREFSKENFSYIERWNALKNMTSNLALNMFLSSLLLWEFSGWYVFGGFLILVLLIKRASDYHEWANIDLDNAVYRLKLEDHVSNLLLSKNKSE